MTTSDSMTGGAEDTNRIVMQTMQANITIYTSGRQVLRGGAPFLGVRQDH